MGKMKNNKTKLFIDGADVSSLEIAASNNLIAGVTTNPTLMAKSGITDYLDFAKTLLAKIQTKSVSLEVFSDDFNDMERQARILHSLAENVYVKIPVYNTKGQSSSKLINTLTTDGIKVNVTAIMEIDQVEKIVKCLNPEVPSYLSVFAGRIADTGKDPLPIMKRSLSIMSQNFKTQLIWASPREVLNYYQAEQIGCHIITMTKDLIHKLELKDKNLTEYSIDTVKMFFTDAEEAHFKF
jgi:transaldolase